MNISIEVDLSETYNSHQLLFKSSHRT